MTIQQTRYSKIDMRVLYPSKSDGCPFKNIDSVYCASLMHTNDSEVHFLCVCGLYNISAQSHVKFNNGGYYE